MKAAPKFVLETKPALIVKEFKTSGVPDKATNPMVLIF